jgi:hypothetical protein|tara:strand:- start:222 stop:515 length:294 start_codon:yes stop_codon:yes gene_type:complete
MVERYKYEYHGWRITVYFNGYIRVNRKGEDRLYAIGNISRIEQQAEYVFLYLTNGGFIQVKFEVSDFLVIDEFDENGEFVDSVGNWVFGENNLVDSN